MKQENSKYKNCVNDFLMPVARLYLCTYITRYINRQ